MFLGRITDPDDFIAFLGDKTYERFHHGPFPGEPPAAATFFPIATLADGRTIVCTNTLEVGDVRWPIEGSTALSDWGW